VRTFKDGRSDYPFGGKPVRRIEYDKTGRMYALLMRSGRRSTLLPGKPFPEASDEDLRDAVTGFVAQFGTFDIEQSTQMVIHHVEASLVPSWVGTDLKRWFRVDGGRLILTFSTPDSSLDLVFEREPD
jgi:Lipocalin-like domain